MLNCHWLYTSYFFLSNLILRGVTDYCNSSFYFKSTVFMQYLRTNYTNEELFDTSEHIWSQAYFKHIGNRQS